MDFFNVIFKSLFLVHPHNNRLLCTRRPRTIEEQHKMIECICRNRHKCKLNISIAVMENITINHYTKICFLFYTDFNESSKKQFLSMCTSNSQTPLWSQLYKVPREDFSYILPKCTFKVSMMKLLQYDHEQCYKCDHFEGILKQHNKSM